MTTNTTPSWWNHAIKYSDITPGENYVCFTIKVCYKTHMFTDDDDDDDDDEGYCSGFDEEINPECVKTDKQLLKRYVPMSYADRNFKTAEEVEDEDIREWKEKSRCNGSCVCNMWDTYEVIKITLVKGK